MTKHIHDSALLYVDNRELPYQVTMYTDEHSPVCSIRFGSSFTLQVFDPVALKGFIRDLQEFADAAHELHYGPQPQRVAALSEEMSRLQQKLEACGVTEDYVPDDPTNYDNAAAADVYIPPSRRQSKVENVSGPLNDPLNW